MVTPKQNFIKLELVPGEAVVCCTPLQVPLAGVQDEVKLLSALADGTRLQIVTMLARVDEEICVCDITGQFTLGQPTISHHLKVLREAGLVKWEKRGLWVYYSLNREVLERATSYLNGLLAGSKVPAGV